MASMKVKAFDGSMTNKYLDPLPCGGIPTFDELSGYAYRCDACGAVIGSIGMPSLCNEAWQDKLNKKRMWEKLNGV